MCRIHETLEMIGMAATTAASYTWGALNSDFGIAATGSFFGAVGGYFIVMVTNRRAEILSKIDRIKVAIALTHSIFNLAYSLNKQHLYDLKEEYTANKAEFVEAKSGETKGVITVPFNNKTIFLPYTDFELINSKLLSETGFAGRTFILATTLIRCLYDLKGQLEYRHAILNEINSISTAENLSTHDKACLYYGIKITGQEGDFRYENYSGIMEAIKISVESCIWFSKELAFELIETAEKESKKIHYKRPKVGSVDYSDVDPKYMPDDADFKDYREKFTKA